MNKKYFFITAMIVAIVTVAGWNIGKSKSGLSEVALNVEALAQESDCPNGCLDRPGLCFCYKYYSYDEASH